MKAASVISDLRAERNPEKGTFLQRFFKTGKGQYAEGDIFWGITVPVQRAIAQKYKELPLSEVSTLITSPIHEQRLTGLLILTYAFSKASQEKQREIFEFYFAHRKWVNNWDLVDVTTPKIVGEYILAHPSEQKKVFSLITSFNVWERRIALLATFPFIQKKDFTPLLALAPQVLNDPHDLIHKATGWMLREAGKRDVKILEKLLDQYASVMPRTMLRYSLEKFAPEKRQHYMKQKPAV